MTDVALQYDPTTRTFDIAVGSNGDLVEDNGLDTAVMLSLYIDRRAEPDDEIPDGTNDRRGWWGGRIGSRLWLLARAKEITDTLRDAKHYAEEALQWMIDAGAARAVAVTAEHIRTGVLGLLVVIEKPDGGRYEKLWEYQLEAA